MRSSAGCRPPPRPPGRAGATPSTEILAGALALTAGRPAEAEADAQQGLALAATHGNHLLTTCGLGVLATSSLRGGDLAAAVGYVRSYQDRMARHGPGYGQTRCLVVAAQLAEARQDTEAAAEIVARLQLCLRQHPGVLAGDLTASGWLVRFALAQGNREAAEAVCAAAAGLAAGSPGLAGVTAAAAHARGLLDQDTGALQRAVQDSPDPWARASAAEDLGVLLIGRNDFEAGGRRLEDSLVEAYDQTAALRDGKPGPPCGCGESASGGGISPTPSARKRAGRASPTPSVPCLTWSPRA